MPRKHNWLISYEKSQHKESIPNESSWASSRYGQMPWQEAQRIPLRQLGTKMTVGKAWFRLKKFWEKYKRAGITGEYRGDVAYNIIQYQAALDLPRSDLPETEGVSDFEFEDWGKEEGQETETDERPAEWSSFDEQLLREEQEAEADEYEQRKADIFRDWD
jgi:hypothetical protein